MPPSMTFHTFLVGRGEEEEGEVGENFPPFSSTKVTSICSYILIHNRYNYLWGRLGKVYGRLFCKKDKGKNVDEVSW